MPTTILGGIQMIVLLFILLAYEYIPDSEIESSAIATSLITGQSGSEEDLLSPKVIYMTFFKATKYRSFFKQKS